MELKTKKQQKPKWFQGQVYTEREEVQNPFSGETYELNGLELSIYDFIIGCQMVFDTYHKGTRPNEQVLLPWFLA